MGGAHRLLQRPQKREAAAAGASCCRLLLLLLCVGGVPGAGWQQVPAGGWLVGWLAAAPANICSWLIPTALPSAPPAHPLPTHLPCLQVSFGVFEGEEDAARQYDRALILEKGRAAKTNFPIRDYEGEAAEYEALLLRT